MTLPLTCFGDRLLAANQRWPWRTGKGPGTACMLRRNAAQVLMGVPWQAPPSSVVGGWHVVSARSVSLLAAALDTAGAAPGAVTPLQLNAAWHSAGYGWWLRRCGGKALVTARLFSASPELRAQLPLIEESWPC